MMYLGDFNAGATIRFMWNSFNSSGASVTRATNGTIQVYKNGGTTQDTGDITDTEDFDSLTGVHLVVIDTSIDTTFYTNGAEYAVVLSGATIDGQTVNAVLAHFSLRNRSGNVTHVNGTAQTGGDLAAMITTVDDLLDTEVAAIKAKTDNLPSDPADASDIAALIDAIPTAAENRAEMDSNSTKLAAILEDTGTTLDDLIDTEVAAIKTETDKIAAIKAKTDSLTFTVANQVDANIQSVNDVSITGDGSATPWGPA